MRFSDLRAATPMWETLSLWIETHPEAKNALGDGSGWILLIWHED